jgi:hypothetical protein
MMCHPEFGIRGGLVRAQMPRDPSDTTPAWDGQAEATLLPP